MDEHSGSERNDLQWHCCFVVCISFLSCFVTLRTDRNDSVDQLLAVTSFFFYPQTPELLQMCEKIATIMWHNEVK